MDLEQPSREPAGAEVFLGVPVQGALRLREIASTWKVPTVVSSVGHSSWAWIVFKVALDGDQAIEAFDSRAADFCR